MNFGLTPMSACEEFALNHVPSTGSSRLRTRGETISSWALAALYLLTLVLVSPQAADAPPPDVQSDPETTATLTDAPPPSRQGTE